MPITNPRNLFRIEVNLTCAVIEHDKIVARAVHLRETQHVPIVMAAGRLVIKPSQMTG